MMFGWEVLVLYRVLILVPSVIMVKGTRNPYLELRGGQTLFFISSLIPVPTIPNIFDYLATINTAQCSN